MRGQPLGKDALRVYTERLSREPVEDVVNALLKLGELKRKESISADGLSRFPEPAIPEIGSLLSLVEIERIARDNRSIAKKSERLVRWQCPSCKSVQSGYPATNASLDRRCYKKINKDLECGAAMEITFDQNEGGNLGDDSGLAKWEAPDWVTR